MIVVSAFDGYSSGLQVLKELGFHVDEYHAFEIDPYAIKISEKNHPEIIRHGDVNNWWYADIPWYKVDLLIAGSPCQGFSFAGKQLAFDDPRSALFFKWVEMVNVMRFYRGDRFNFMLENVNMNEKHLNVISDTLGVKPIFINSKVHSPQSRPRWYWSNQAITQPREIYSPLSSVLEKDVPLKYFHTDKAIEYMNRTGTTGRVKWSYKFHSDESNGKSQCVTANYHKGVPNNVLVCGRVVGRRINPQTGKRDDHNKDIKIQQYWEPRYDEKSGCLTTVTKDTMVGNETVCIRKFTPVECERLQGLPDNYTEGVSDTQRYKMLGNGWQLNTIKHTFKDILR